MTVVATFYKFVSFPNYQAMRSPLLAFCQEQNLKGTILLAAEGINGTLAGEAANIDAAIAYLRANEGFADLEVRKSTTPQSPFERLKVKLKREIVTLGVPEVNPNQQVGTYVTPQQWNELISDPEVVVIDTRNEYEVDIGTFRGATNPHTHSFRQFPDYARQNLHPARHQKVAMFCTGGIRCEKASSYLLQQGFEQVYHLKGGILHYLEAIPPEESLWEGECFVFDERVAVKSGLQPGSYEMCVACGHPISEADKASPQYKMGVSCPYCYQADC
ncbi:MAG: rhodanese-related sulfurtransferase [Jaaginema sp. PMC 1079.18]|nr:rhodanese-related sulfurtransferase [Jaaginema sp. PMC 1080.18]MEC4851848.1 rhodanese-related sulfurtransferase [Jaaginema sp. PMC 1079.18]MEC4864489.1 rhodanese-related sulfurtransferase [Jaaginema sp. PMC 1078.18]